MSEAAEAGLHFLAHPWIDEEVALDDFGSKTRSAVEEGLADADAGRVTDADVVFDRLLAKYGTLKLFT